MIRSILHQVIDMISFNAQIRDLADMLTHKAGQFEAPSGYSSHPGGFIREFAKRRMEMAESYSRVALQLEGINSRQRGQNSGGVSGRSFFASSRWAVTVNTNSRPQFWQVAIVSAKFILLCSSSCGLPSEKTCACDLIASCSFSNRYVGWRHERFVPDWPAWRPRLPPATGPTGSPVYPAREWLLTPYPGRPGEPLAGFGRTRLCCFPWKTPSATGQRH